MEVVPLGEVTCATAPRAPNLAPDAYLAEFFGRFRRTIAICRTIAPGMRAAAPGVRETVGIAAGSRARTRALSLGEGSDSPPLTLGKTCAYHLNAHV